MQSKEDNYQGVETLENLREAVNYNNWLERNLLKFIGAEKTALDFGAGNGEFASRLAKHGIKVDCIEADKNLSAHLRAQGFAVAESFGEAQKKYRCIYSLNVLEHIEDDVDALRNLYNLLETGGSLFIYVPAFMCLYSDFDKKIGHFRRYKKLELVSKFQHAGFAVETAKYADSLGFFAWLVMKSFQKGDKEPSRVMIKIYDRLVFPLSKIADLLFNKFFGKNLLVIGVRKV